MKNLLSAILVLSAVSVAAQAELLTLKPGTQTCEGRSVPGGATANIPNKPAELTTAAFGLRAKKVAVVNVKVYCAEILVTDGTLYAHDAGNALASVVKMPTSAIRLDFLRAVDAQTVKSSFVDAFNANHVDVNAPKIAAFLNVVAAGGTAESGKSLTIVFDLMTAAIYYEDGNGKVSSMPSDPDTNAQILSIWLGTPADAGLATLKSQLTSVR